MGGQNSKLDHLQDSRDVMMKRDQNRVAKDGNSQTLCYIRPGHKNIKSASAVMTTKDSTSEKSDHIRSG